MGFIKDETPWCGGRIGRRVLCLRANNPSPMTYVGTNTYIVAEPGAKRCVVIDPAPVGEQVQRILHVCEEAGFTVGAIVATHDHPDHIEGIPQLAAATGAPAFAPRLGAIREMLKEGTACSQLNELPTGLFVPFEDAPQFEVIALPGHSEDSVGLLLSSEKTLFTGDVLFRHGPTVVFYPDGVLGNYFESLDKLQRMVEEGKAQRFLPGHGYPIEDPLRIIKATREHRKERLAQVKKALASGTPANPDALFNVVYQGVDPALKAPSIRSIQAQLKYLGVEAQ